MAQENETDNGDFSQEEEVESENNRASCDDIKKDQRASSTRKKDRRA